MAREQHHGEGSESLPSTGGNERAMSIQEDLIDDESESPEDIRRLQFIERRARARHPSNLQRTWQKPTPASKWHFDLDSTEEDAATASPIFKPQILWPGLEHAEIPRVRFGTDMAATADSPKAPNDPRAMQVNPGCHPSLHVPPTIDSIRKEILAIQKTERKCRARRGVLAEKLVALQQPGALPATTTPQQPGHKRPCHHPECSKDRCVALLPLQASAPPFPHKKVKSVPMNTDVHHLKALDALRETFGPVDPSNPKELSPRQLAIQRAMLSTEQNNLIFTYTREHEYITMKMGDPLYNNGEPFKTGYITEICCTFPVLPNGKAITSPSYLGTPGGPMEAKSRPILSIDLFDKDATHLAGATCGGDFLNRKPPDLHDSHVRLIPEEEYDESNQSNAKIPEFPVANMAPGGAGYYVLNIASCPKTVTQKAFRSAKPGKTAYVVPEHMPRLIDTLHAHSERQRVRRRNQLLESRIQEAREEMARHKDRLIEFSTPLKGMSDVHHRRLALNRVRDAYREAQANPCPQRRKRLDDAVRDRSGDKALYDELHSELKANSNNAWAALKRLLDERDAITATRTKRKSEDDETQSEVNKAQKRNANDSPSDRAQTDHQPVDRDDSSQGSRIGSERSSTNEPSNVSTAATTPPKDRTSDTTDTDDQNEDDDMAFAEKKNNESSFGQTGITNRVKDQLRFRK